MILSDRQECKLHVLIGADLTAALKCNLVNVDAFKGTLGMKDQSDCIARLPIVSGLYVSQNAGDRGAQCIWII